MDKSESIKELSTALSKAQGELKNPHFDSTNPHYKSKFASLAAVREAVIPIFAKYGLAVTQWPVAGSGVAGCVTVVSHASGEHMQQEFLIPVEKPNAHGYASALTYARRLSLQAVAAVVGDDDDDANATLKAQVTPIAGAGNGLTEAQRKRVQALYSSVIDCFEAGYGGDKVFEVIDEAKLDNDEKVYLASMDYTKEQKAALKKASLEKRAKEAA